MSAKVNLTNETKYQLLLQISHKVRNTLDLDQILYLLLDSLQSVLDYQAAGIFILNGGTVIQRQQHTGALIAGIARRGFDPTPDEQDRMLMQGEGLTGYVIRTGEAVIVPDVRQDGRYIVGRAATLSEIAVPIIQDGRVIGALNVESDRLAAFNTNDLDILRFFADAAGISIEKATLHQSLLEKQRLEQQLQMASAIQSRLIPESAPEFPGYDISGICLPTFAIGGDYLDYIPLVDGRLGISIADVSGTGVPAALVMSAFRALLRVQAQTQIDPALVCTSMNTLLPDFNGNEGFVTAVYGILDSHTNTFTYTNCGHHPILCVRADGNLELHKSGGPGLNLFDHPQFETGMIGLNQGDILLIYTDGLVESTDQDGNAYGFERLKEILINQKMSLAHEILEAIIQSAKSFCNADNFPDDITLIAIRCTG